MAKKTFDEDEPLLGPEAPPLTEALAGARMRRQFDAAVFEAGLAHLRSRRTRRRVGFAGLLAAAYAAGVVTFYAFSGSSAVQPAATEAVAPAAIAPAPAVTDRPVLTEALLRDREQLAVFISQQPKEQRRALLRAAGDWFLGPGDDVVMAAHCYRRYLTMEAENPIAAPPVNETWLLQSMRFDPKGAQS